MGFGVAKGEKDSKPQLERNVQRNWNKETLRLEKREKNPNTRKTQPRNTKTQKENKRISRISRTHRGPRTLLVNPRKIKKEVYLEKMEKRRIGNLRKMG